MKKINAQGLQIYTFVRNESDFISLTDMARYKNAEEPADVVKNWMRNRSTIEYLGFWEKINNPNFKLVEFDQFRSKSGSNSFVLSPHKWIETTTAIGLISKSGRYSGGTFAHKDIAFEFASWLSAEFKLYLIKEFQRLKIEETERLALGWDAKRLLTKINYRIHADAIKEEIILPQKLSKKDADIIYASEADVLNKALFGRTAKEWRDKNPKLSGNVRDYADVSQLVCLSNLENINAEYIRSGISQGERLLKLNESAIHQMRSLTRNTNIKKLEDKNIN
ncbi:MAG: DNA-binding protein [Candidatus Staskawiczbacteria bacterium RIFOXYB2_FULL_32_9]|uniref:DNA-binding protein n=1 Tax=Candidatus Staskawiczbacteria bacterium RIFOXYD1_FULL_32_13 TaxID=1802234 RepID=A0A1G2JQY3_9BACT|nr:MAG: hypothetical protein UR22_C0023G0008 [Parcubacteria group bacterium GW2011_GWC2_32_10]OGZ79696.1 MAG: DNA-binding protein [Candidatus Staskawiczbacteria bacterium RIFOXYB1_FULL_32_11]OGZ84350.1 MAG: DNA-binding protein [Candidatus Staskawiczbacteria bacterium RIFOXYB2_FULL_32_9]OGZ85523.1 MAG: DNA-binding protein [Candidatus Staskawiczbacteria bacterium RIFOXYC2_FULL_32_10]OGZ88658.1 MAG: DNA-binding protein [Candidatus Staskawiczbacteria bacterium RIFOXYD1_FULL_32_13]